MSRFEELDKLVKDGMMDKDAADDIKEKCSLTIREGISMRTIKESYFRGFPHYT